MACLPLSSVASGPALHLHSQVHGPLSLRHRCTLGKVGSQHTHTCTRRCTTPTHAHVHAHRLQPPKKRTFKLLACTQSPSQPGTYGTSPNPRHLGSRTNRFERCLPSLISKVPRLPVPAAPTDQQALPPFFLANSKSVFKILESNASPESPRALEYCTTLSLPEHAESQHPPQQSDTLEAPCYLPPSRMDQMLSADTKPKPHILQEPPSKRQNRLGTDLRRGRVSGDQNHRGTKTNSCLNQK